ncbi:MAG: methylenetetrahydrofolate reductase C-terminal domain-containing protein [Verrucomicrobia bacterium]|nr:methylenetetrahydrofolate reductase C-terminal domain-containing protein [Verrucomicrobiota bacterium]
MIEPRPNPSFRELLNSGRFIYGAELVTTRGIPEPDQRPKLVELGEGLAADSRISWVSITDNPGGNPMIPADWIANLLKPRGKELVIHLTCKDLNRNGLESAAWRYAAEGFHNILALTGDYPTAGFHGPAQPVFDLDSVSLVSMLRAMNEGLETTKPSGKVERLPKTNFFIGCAVSPFKRQERELLPQYFKLARKIQCGAQWVIPQLGYDMRKFHEIKLFLDWSGLSAPVIGNVYVLNKGVARMFNQNKIPGCVVSDALYAQVERYAAGPDKGKAFFTELAAKQLAVFKGLGFAAGYLGGIHKAEAFAQIIDLAESYGPNDWKEFVKEIQYPKENEFYLFERDPATGLGNRDLLNADYLRSLDEPAKAREVTLSYRFTRLMHSLAFTPGKRLFPAIQKTYARLEAGKHTTTLKAMHAVEHASKTVMFGCKDCGDCSLPDAGYFCPRASCSKTQRNGPCGGSFDGRCELDDKDCIWARAYDRLKYYGESRDMIKGPAVFANASLSGTSGWANNFLGRDHHQVPQPVAQTPSAKAQTPNG